MPILEDKLCAVAYDVEVYPNYFLAGFQDVNTGETRQFEISERRNDATALRDYWSGLELVFGFNSIGYDDHILNLVLAGAEDPWTMYAASAAIIDGGDHYRKWWSPFSYAPIVIDLFVLLGDKAGGLKECGVKLDHPTTQELPVDPHSNLTPDEMDLVARYNLNDLAITTKLVANQETAFNARWALTAAYDVNVLNRKNAGIADTIIRAAYDRTAWPGVEWERAGREIIDRRICFADLELDAVLRRMKDHAFRYQLLIERVREDGREREKKSLEYARYSDKVVYRATTFSAGQGGLHSVDRPAIFEASDAFEIIDIDVESFYPVLIDNLGLHPAHLAGPRFNATFRSLIDRRLDAKHAGNTVLDAGLKIAINSVFGKTSEAYSWMIDPVMSATVCMNGQLILLMLIEYVSAVEGVTVLSANTDGILVRAPRGSTDLRAAVACIADTFRLGFKFTSYERFVRRDINNYIGRDVAGAVKAKGCFGYDKADLTKKATKRIVIDAVQRYFLAGVPVETTIRGCRQLTEFVDFFKTAPGWKAETEDGTPLGKITRWYESTAGQMLIKRKGAQMVKFAGVEAATIVNDLPEAFPADINYDHYIKEAQALIESVEHPEARAARTLSFLEIDAAQRALLRRNQETVAADPVRVAAVDLTRYRTDYLAQTRGNAYDTMKTLLVRLWISQGGALTRGDLLALGEALDEPEGKFAGREKRKLKKLVEWVASEIVPFVRPKAPAEAASDALAWAQAQVEAQEHPRRLHHSNPFDSSLMPGKWLTDFLDTRDVCKLANRIAANSVRNKYTLSVEGLATILSDSLVIADKVNK